MYEQGDFAPSPADYREAYLAHLLIDLEQLTTDQVAAVLRRGRELLTENRQASKQPAQAEPAGIAF